MQHNSQNKVCFAVSLYQIHGLQWTDIHKSTEPANVIPLCPHMHMYQDRHKTAKCIMGFKQAVSPLYPHQDPIRPSKFRTKAPAPVMSRPGMVPPTSSAKPSTCSLISLRENHDHIFFAILQSNGFQQILSASKPRNLVTTPFLPIERTWRTNDTRRCVSFRCKTSNFGGSRILSQPQMVSCICLWFLYRFREQSSAYPSANRPRRRACQPNIKISSTEIFGGVKHHNTSRHITTPSRKIVSYLMK